MAFTSIQDITNKMSLGQKLTTNWFKTTPLFIGESSLKAYNTFQWQGTPISNSYPGNVLQPVTCSDQTPGAIYTGYSVSPLKKHVLNIDVTAGSQSAMAPISLFLVDILAYYPGINLNSTAKQITNTPLGTNILPLRDGVQHTGKNAFMFLESIQGGATIRADTCIEYTSDLNTKGIAACPISVASSGLVPGCILNCNGGSIYVPSHNPFITLNPNHLGVTSIQSFASLNNMEIPPCQLISIGGKSNASIVICEPILEMPYITGGVPTFRDFVYNKPTFPRIKDGACLAFLYMAGANIYQGTTYMATMDLVWG